MKYSEEDLRKYVEKCFADAFKAEDRPYDSKAWNCEWILIKNQVGVYQFYPVLWCKYSRVRRKVEYRLKNNIKKNFSLHYGDTDQMRVDVRSDSIDLNFTQAKFIKTDGSESIYLDVYDDKTCDNDLTGECMPAYTYEKLLFQYWGITAEMYRKLPTDDEKRDLPYSFHSNWEEYSSLYKETFNKAIGSDYDIICSSGLTRVWESSTK